ncbi:MAG TPA: response regulator transcription factor [Bacteroidetes bacterium]|nr:response regulator transcription factor [Bacteroidota bacterium]
MYTAILVDDEADALEVLYLNLTENFPNIIKVLGKTSSFTEATLLIREYKPDLLFLDIDLGKGQSGFDVVRQIEDTNYMPKVIFTTGYQQFAIRAVQVQAFDYLLKPVGEDDISQLVIRLNKADKAPQMPSPLGSGIVVNISDAIYRLNLDDIIYFEGNGNYTNIHLKGREKSILSSATLNSFESEVAKISNLFFRTHKSYLINLNEIDRLEKKALGKVLVLKNGHRVSISRLRYPEFAKVYFLH